MSVHKTPKGEEDLILDDKLDMARTLARLNARQSVRRVLNDIEPKLVENHAKELKSGSVSKHEIDLNALFRAAIESGDSA